MDFLTTNEVATYTGYKRPSDQIRQLVKMGVPHDLDRRNRPVVLRDTILNRLSDSSRLNSRRQAINRA